LWRVSVRSHSQTAGTLTVYRFTYSSMDCLKMTVHSRNMWQE